MKEKLASLEIDNKYSDKDSDTYMKIKGIEQENFNHYKLCSMVVIFPSCDWKCKKTECHNSKMALLPNREVTYEEIYNEYQDNPLSGALVLAGLEPLMESSIEDVIGLVNFFREKRKNNDPIVIYTGYNKEEVSGIIQRLSIYQNIIMKFGRYENGHRPHIDKILGISLASPNQYGEKIS